MQSGGSGFTVPDGAAGGSRNRKILSAASEYLSIAVFLGARKDPCPCHLQTTAIKFTWAALEDYLDATTGTECPLIYLLTMPL